MDRKKWLASRLLSVVKVRVVACSSMFVHHVRQCYLQNDGCTEPVVTCCGWTAFLQLLLRIL
jgi:hypothetical protein